MGHERKRFFLVDGEPTVLIEDDAIKLAKSKPQITRWQDLIGARLIGITSTQRGNAFLIVDAGYAEIRGGEFGIGVRPEKSGRARAGAKDTRGKAERLKTLLGRSIATTKPTPYSGAELELAEGGKIKLVCDPWDFPLTLHDGEELDHELFSGAPRSTGRHE